VTAWKFWPGGSGARIRQGLFAAIGVPGSRPGDVTESVATGPDAASGSADITGYLMRDNKGLYEYTTPEKVDFDTQTAGSDATRNVMSVAGHDYPVPIPAGTIGGFQITTVSQRYAGDPPEASVTSRWFTTSSSDKGAALDQVRALHGYLDHVIDSGKSQPEFVLVATRGDPRVPVPGEADHVRSLEIYAELSAITTDFTQLGGTRTDAYRMLSDPNGDHSWTLAGETGLGTGRGYQLTGSVTGTTPGLSTAAVTGDLTRSGPFHGLAFGTANPAADRRPLPSLLEDEVFKAPVHWPEYGNKGREDAIGWLGMRVYDTAQPRTQYWTLPYSLELWNGKLQYLQRQLYPRGVSFSRADFDWAQQELETEIGWIEEVHGYLTTLAEPFAKGSLDSWAALQSIAADVNGKVVAGPADKVRENILAIFSFALAVGAELPEPVGPVIGIASAIYSLAAELTSINAEGTEDAAAAFDSKVGDLGVDLVARLQQAQATLTNQFFDIVVSDYGRLKTIADCAAGHKDGCPEDPSQWQFTQDDQREAANTLQYGSQATFYAALVGAKYATYDLPAPAEEDFTTPDNFVGFDHDPFAEVCIFKGDPAYSTTVAQVVRNSQQFITEHYVSVLGHVSQAGTIFDPYKMSWPDASIINRMFGPVSPTGDISKGGLGMDREATFASFPDHQTSLKFPLSDSPQAAWRGDGAAHCLHV
jgi:hypothetical protein